MKSIGAITGLVCAVALAFASGAQSAAARTWAIEPVPPTATDGVGFLAGVSCPAADRCVAVGGESFFHPPGPLAERWDGARWTPVPVDGDPDEGNVLQGVSCAARDDCMAVGYDQHQGPIEPTAQHFDGTRWEQLPVPYPDLDDEHPYPQSELTSVSCSAPDACTAVGADTGRGQPLAERWDGHAWTIQAIAQPPAGGRFSSVSCRPRFCVAVGSQSTSTADVALIERWNGRAWSIVGAHVDGLLNAVSCPASHWCTAVGGRTAAGGTVPLVAQETPWGWRAVPSPAPAGAQYASLDAITCDLAFGCTATGASQATGADAVPLIERRRLLRWTLEDAAIPADPGGNASLDGVSCVRRACQAVGRQPGDDGLLAEGTLGR